MPKTRIAIAAALVASAAFAQTPGTIAHTGGAAPEQANTAQYYERYADEVRARKAIEGARAELRTAKFRAALADETPAKLAVAWDRFATGSGAIFTAVHLSLPHGIDAIAGQKAVIFGELRDENGGVVTTFEEAATINESKGELFVEKTLLASAANVTGAFGVAVKGEVVATAHATMPRIVADPRSGMSDLIVSNDVHNLTAMQSPFEPFAFGGTKVVPRGDLTFGKSDEVWLFAEYRNPALAKGALPSLTMRTVVEGNGKRLASGWQPVESAPLKGVPGHFGIGTTVDLSPLPPGQYSVVLSVKDAAANQTYERMKTVVVQ